MLFSLRQVHTPQRNHLQHREAGRAVRRALVSCAPLGTSLAPFQQAPSLSSPPTPLSKAAEKATSLAFTRRCEIRPLDSSHIYEGSGDTSRRYWCWLTKQTGLLSQGNLWLSGSKRSLKKKHTWKQAGTGDLLRVCKQKLLLKERSGRGATPERTHPAASSNRERQTH